MAICCIQVPMSDAGLAEKEQAEVSRIQCSHEELEIVSMRMNVSTITESG
jgi:hypothetical protein